MRDWCLPATLSSVLFLVGFSSSAAAQVKPRFVIAVDTSGSMTDNFAGSVDTQGDGVGRVPIGGDNAQRILDGVYYGCASPRTGAGFDQNNDCFPNDSRMWIAKNAIRKMILAFGDVEWSLSRFKQTQALNQLATSYLVDIDNGPCAGTQGQCSGTYNINYQGESQAVCGTVGFGTGEMLVGFPGVTGEAFPSADNRPAILRWMDNVETSFHAPTGTDLALVDLCNHRGSNDCELRAPPAAFTPLGGIIKTSGDYAVASRMTDADSACRQYSIILVTDGDETCVMNEADVRHPYRRAFSFAYPGVTFPGSPAGIPMTPPDIRTYVVGINTSTTLLNNIAAYGGTMQAFFANSPAALSAALSQIVSDSLRFEVCNGLDDDCDGQVDEDLPIGQPGTAPQPGSLFCDGEGHRSAAQNTQVRLRSHIPDNILATVPIKTTVPPNYNPDQIVCGRVVDNCQRPGSDDDCDGAMDEDGSLTACGTCPGAPDLCDGIDNDCDGFFDETAGSMQNFSACPITCTEDVPCGSNVGECDPGVYRCMMGQLDNVCFGQTTGTMEVCDGLDNDCNGIIDDPAILARACTTPYGDVGICQPGTQYCANTSIGELEDAMGYRVDANGDPFCVGQVLPEDRELCDVLDHDCDGDPFTCTQDTCVISPEPAFVGNVCGLGVGVCTGVLECDENGDPDGGPPELVCTAPTGSAELCNNLDDDCDGTVDENAAAGTDLGGINGGADGAFCGNETRTAGRCNPGAFDCVNGHWQCLGEVGPAAEVCNGQNDDCDANTDEAADVAANDPRIGQQCGTSIGECEPGLSVCSGGQIVCTPVQGPVPEACDGRDNDCDNLTDENLPDDNPRDGVRDLVACGLSTGLCDPGLLTCVAEPSYHYECVGGVGPVDEICDGEDNDCDGQTDECAGDPGSPEFIACDTDPLGAQGPAPTNQGLGAGGGDVCGTDVPPCMTGKTKCVQDVDSTNTDPDEPGFVCVGNVDGMPEICNGDDDDCDTKIDEDLDPLNDPELGRRCGVAGVGPCRIDVDGDGPDDTEDNACGQCRIGQQDCVAGMIECVGAIGPEQYERCNRADDDCDGATDECVDPEDVPSLCTAGEVDPNTPVGTVCGEGGCQAGVNRCVDGSLECVGVQQGMPEICNNLDDDCDTLIDEGFQKGAPCGEDEGECQPGVLICDPDGSGELVCTGEITPVEEECDALDNDCDTRVDEGLGLGEACGTDEGECERGQLACVGGRTVCSGEIGPTPEVCDCKDNDCDGNIDEDTTQNPVCPGAASCVMCQCALPCVEAVEFGAQCPQGKAAVTTDEGCFCVGAQCNSLECQEETIEVDGVVQCSPDDDRLSVCVCKNNACTFRCSGVTCTDGLVCDPTDGRCKQQSCLLPQFACPEDERCTVMDGVWRCVEDECAAQVCGADEACRDGNCIGSCATVMCQPGEQCQDGECAVDRCAGVLCDPGLICDPSDGDCVLAGACVDGGCPDGQVCDPVGGVCSEDPCLRTRCPYAQQCNSETGECELRCGGELLFCGEDDCINPLTSREHCGASGDCMGENAGESCASGLVCSEGRCSDMCANNLVNCGGECIDPQRDRLHCGASGRCTGDEAGEICQTGFTCIEGSCRRTTGAGGSGGSGEDVTPAVTRVIASGGGGCTCSAVGAEPSAPSSGRGALSMLLLALACAWLLRRRGALRRLRPSATALLLAAAALSTSMLGSGCKIDTFCLDCPSPGDETPGPGQDGGTGGSGGRDSEGGIVTPDTGVPIGDADVPDTNVPRSDGGCIDRELCNGLDDDCDNRVDEDADPTELNIDINTDVLHCGGCGQACALAHAFNACVDGACRIDRDQGNAGCDVGFVDFDGDDANGCEYRCTKTTDGDSLCDLVDNDCDKEIDEDIDFASDRDNCGSCGFRCSFAHADQGSVCVNEVCTLDDQQCDDGFANTDGEESNGCEYRCPVFPIEDEWCDGVDDDCDHQTDEGVATSDPEIGDACGEDEGECVAGQIECRSGAEVCEGSVGPQEEVCDGLDNDCDGTTDTDHPDIGLPCGEATPGSQCSKGTLQIPSGGCSGGVVRDLACVGAQGPVAELCDGLDNDCDGRSDEAVAGVRPGEGQLCINGPNGIEIVTSDPPGECAAGMTSCESGRLLCRNEVAPQPVELCDDLDQDCDGDALNGFTPDVAGGTTATSGPDPRVGDPCGIDTGECAFGVRTCHLDTGVLSCDGQTLAATEICDGRDNDCDGSIDERPPSGFLAGENVACITNANGTVNTNPPASASTGECQTGITVCTAGRIGCSGQIGPQPELCDAQDRDCDGSPINGVASTDPAVGDPCGPPTVGVCRSGTTACMAGATPTIVCQGALPSSTYTPPAQTNTPEVACDGIDNDCDGGTDEGSPAAYAGQSCCDLQTGFSCCAQGTRQCSNGAIKCVYPPGTPLPQVEACGDGPGGNGANDDCDANTDEGFNLATDVNNCGACGNACTPTVPDPHAVIVCEAADCKIGACVGDFVDADFDNNPNTEADWRNGCETACTFTGTEICDSEDNDCNGTVDDLATVPTQVCIARRVGVCNVPELLIDGPECNNGMLVCDVAEVVANGDIQNYEADEQTCDDLDNDCDGAVDEMAPLVGQPCSNGIGACRTTGVYICDAGAPGGFRCNAPPALPPSAEICDGLDNNCNNAVDDFAAPSTSNVVDNFELINLGASTGNTLVMAFEASRPDSAADDPGTLTNKPCSTNGVLPWANVTWNEARSACCALNAGGQCTPSGQGWRLCDASTWGHVCRGSSQTCLWAYSNTAAADCDHGPGVSTFENVCAGAEATDDGLITCADPGDTECATVTGAATFAQCFAEWGATDVWDMSGNVQEWTNTAQGTNIYEIRGGGFNDAEIGRKCAFNFEVGNTSFRFPTTGFRCCNYPAAPSMTCTTYTASGLPVQTPDMGSVDSTISVPATASRISAVRVLNAQGTTAEFGDLEFRLIGPSTTSVLMVEKRCGSDDNWAFDLRDDATTPVNNDGVFCAGTSPVGGGIANAYVPQDPLSAFNGQLATGTWTLRIADTINRSGGGDIATLTGWQLEVCVSPYVIP